MAENSSMANEQKQNEGRQNELIDDEDAIDRLLMDNAFDNFDEDEEDEFAEIDELISDRLEDTPSESSEEESDDVDELIASVISSADQENEEETEDDFIEIDEFADDEFSGVSDDFQADAVIDEFAEDEPENKDKGVLATDFDISAEEGQDEIVMENAQEEPVAATAGSRDQEHLDVTAEKNSGREAEAAAALVTISAQLAELQNEQHIIRQQLETVEAKDASMAMTDELDGLNREQKKLQRRLTAVEQNKPVLAYIALGVAILAFLVGGGLGFVALSADSKVAGLSETFLSLEEQVDAWMAKSKNQNGLSSVNTRLDKVDMEVANFSAQIAAVNKNLENGGGLDEVIKLKEQIDQLNERNMQSAAVIEELQQKVDRLEKQKIVVAKKNSKKTPVVKEDWKVNLVSFKQEWYAKRKAAEFEKQGIPAEVMRVVVKGEPWYRLRVKGFATKYKAAAYAAKVKKTLNLSSVWVTKN